MVLDDLVGINFVNNLAKYLIDLSKIDFQKV